MLTREDLEALEDAVSEADGLLGLYTGDKVLEDQYLGQMRRWQDALHKVRKLVERQERQAARKACLLGGQ